VGEWTPDGQINITDRQAFFDGGKPNITLKVITIEETPFVMLKEGNNATGNGRYVGFCVDLLRHVSMMAGFDYEIVLSGDGVYGLIDTETGEWNGLVRGLIDR
ncbi:putative glutamate receptor ionotropic, kainate 2 isoform X3, partial [Penaeus vannamei]